MHPRRSEWQLVLFTIFTQMAVGTFAVWGLAAVTIPSPNTISSDMYPRVVLSLVLSFLIFGAMAAGLHLGRPTKAIFSTNNLRSSWLSREALLGGSFGLIGLLLLLRRVSNLEYSNFDGVLIFFGMVCGLVLVIVISKLYMLRTVPAWNHLGTPATFFTTTFLLGVVALTTVWHFTVVMDHNYFFNSKLDKFVVITSGASGLFAAIQFGIFILGLLYLSSRGGVAEISVKIILTDLRGILIWRSLTALVGIGILVVILFMKVIPAYSVVAFGLILASEILGRFLFYGFYQREGF